MVGKTSQSSAVANDLVNYLNGLKLDNQTRKEACYIAAETFKQATEREMIERIEKNTRRSW